MDYLVTLYPSQNQAKKIKAQFPGLSYDKSKHCYVLKNINNKHDIKNISKLCDSLKVEYQLLDNNFQRDASYRKRFFSTYKDHNGWYICAYCGRIIPKTDITVDHITPVAAAKNSKFTQTMLKLFGISNINCAKNLAPACRECNSKKSSHIGSWLLRGYLGRKTPLWLLYHTMSFVLLVILINVLLNTVAYYSF